MLGTILLVILVLMLLGALPTWHEGGYAPAGGIGLIVVIVLILVLLGRL